MNEDSMSADDIKEFAAYLRILSDKQVVGCYEKERQASRKAYAALAEAEAERRGIPLDP
jgi:hypothetical protein